MAKSHEDIHPVSIPAQTNLGPSGAGAYAGCHWGERLGTPWMGRQSITGQQKDKRDTQPRTLTHTSGDNLEAPINLTCMFLDGGRKPECLERTHTYKHANTTQKGPSWEQTWSPLGVRRRC